jgi:hypothetical protein
MMIRYRAKRILYDGEAGDRDRGFQFLGDEQDKFLKHLKSLKTDDIWIGLDEVDLKKMRTIEQNSYYFGVVLRKYACPYYGYDVDEMHSAFAYKFLQFENVDGLPTIRSTKSLKTDEFWYFVEQVRRFMVMEDGIKTPDPERFPGRVAQ